MKISFFIKLITLILVTTFSINTANAKTVLRTDEAAIGEADPAKATDYVDSVLMFNVYDVTDRTCNIYIYIYIHIYRYIYRDRIRTIIHRTTKHT